eukprot:scaffold127415_cov63-Phaeocystis_antarctica.AAC.2
MSNLLAADRELAPCREAKRGHTVWEEVQSTGRREVAGDRGARSVQGRARLQIGSRARGGAHVEHAAHVSNAGGVEAQRLVERRRSLPRVERMVCDAGRGADREAGGGWRPRRTQRTGEGSTADREQGTRGAHIEHVAHVRDAGGVEAQRLVERRRRRGGEHLAHARDAGGVEAQRPVECIRVLRGVKRGGMRFVARCGPDGGRAWGASGDASGAHAEGPTEGCMGARSGARCRVPRGRRRRATAVQAACRGGLDCRLGAGHGEERT